MGPRHPQRHAAVPRGGALPGRRKAKLLPVCVRAAQRRRLHVPEQKGLDYERRDWRVHLRPPRPSGTVADAVPVYGLQRDACSAPGGRLPRGGHGVWWPARGRQRQPRHNRVRRVDSLACLLARPARALLLLWFWLGERGHGDSTRDARCNAAAKRKGRHPQRRAPRVGRRRCERRRRARALPQLFRRAVRPVRAKGQPVHVARTLADCATVPLDRCADDGWHHPCHRV
mmetsp:Transcript_18850/g.56174  ORF Transcript_18850/g.56174 Transcript_18850/m.56174 type:complete len:229 (-) Transcript_18850:1551-2237(-)